MNESQSSLGLDYSPPRQRRSARSRWINSRGPLKARLNRHAILKNVGPKQRLVKVPRQLMAFVWKRNCTKLRRFGDWQCVEVLFNEGDTAATVVLDKDLQEVCLGSIQPLEKMLVDFIPWKELGCNGRK